MTSNTPAALFSKVDLRCKVLVPHDPEFQQRQESFWSFYSRSIEPACILCPESASEVSQILQILIANSQKFAIRSGGHTQWKGANNIQDGVTIDLKALNHVTLHEPSATVDLGPGASWAHVYAELKKSGRVVAGGRNGKVGVGGLILGGGKTFFSGRRGFACDDVISYDVVLADGRIVTADATQHSDLFMALRGGSGNFGIVVNFKMNCFHNSGIWGGLRIHAKELEHSALEMLQDFTTAFRDDADSMLLLFVGFSVFYRRLLYPRYNRLQKKPQEKRTVVMEALISVTANEKAKAFDKFLTLPPLLDTCKPTTVEAMVSEYDPAPSGY
ncbi:MAG: hypothetical protein M1828_001123 [Chrysothrix sp. TS-e1954]|nr:MAG: hypothetical protein M1828_001123 [Chrysothrix sp. TS-e1954]